MKKVQIFLIFLCLFSVVQGKEKKAFDSIIRKVDMEGMTTYEVKNFKKFDAMKDFEREEKKKIREGYAPVAKQYKEDLLSYKKNRGGLEEPLKPIRPKCDVLNKQYKTSKDKKRLKKDLLKLQERAKKKNEKLKAERQAFREKASAAAAQK